MIIFQRKKQEEREHFLLSGEKIRIRRLSPAERLNILSLPGDTAFCKRLSLGLISPPCSMKKAEKMLNQSPFLALEIVRAIQNFTAEADQKALEEWQRLQDERFLDAIEKIENMKNNE